MRTIEIFAIKFDENKVVYEVGDVVSGCVHLKLNDNIKCKAIYMKFTGTTSTEWMEENVPIRIGFSNFTKCSNEKALLEERVNMWGKDTI